MGGLLCRLSLVRGSWVWLPFREIFNDAGRIVRRVCGIENLPKPSGWSWRVVPTLDSTAVEAVRYINDSIDDGTSYGSVARKLNRGSCMTLAGKCFNGSVALRIVTNSVYAGTSS